jgi:hypothetical protein
MSMRWFGLWVIATWLGSGAVAHAQVFTVTQDPIEVGDVAVGQTRSVTGVLAANAAATVRVQVQATGCAEFVVTPTTAFTVAPPNNTETITVRFTPLTAGAKTCVIDLRDDATSAVLDTFSVTGTGTGAPQITLTPDEPLAFGDVDVPQRSTAQTLQLRNSGNAPLLITSATVVNSASYPGVVGAAGAQTVAPNATVEWDIACTPQAQGAQNGVFRIVSNANNQVGTQTNITLTCTGGSQSAAIEVAPSTLAFGDFRFDSNPQRDFHIKNTGGLNITVSTTTFTPDLGTASGELTFAITKAGAPVTLPNVLTAGQQLDVRVTAAPSNRIGLIGGHVDVRTSLGGADPRVTLTGNATAAEISAPPMIDFGGVDIDGPAPTQTLKIRNTGTGRLDVAAIAKQPGADAASIDRFTVVGLPAGARQLEPGTEIPIDITYTPTAVKAPGQVDSLVLVTTMTGAIGGPTQSMITVQGRGIDRVFALGEMPEFPPTFRNPGDQAPIRALTVRNDGEAVLKLTSVMVTGDPVWTLANPGPVDIAGGASHDLMVRFAPSMIGPAAMGELTIVNNDNARVMASVPLAGDGIGRNVEFGSRMINVGYVGLGASTTVEVLEVTNMDTAAFTIREIELADGSAFRIDGAIDVALPASTSRTLALTFEPRMAGPFETMATLYLDQDPEPQAQVRIIGEAVQLSVHGGGGCSTGRPLGAGAFVLLVAAGLAGARRRRPAVLLVVLAAFSARASADDIRVGAFEPTPATSGAGFQLESPDVGRPGAWAATLVASYATNPMAVEVVTDGQASEAQYPIAQRQMLELGGAYAFLGRFEAGVRLPLYSQSGDAPGDPLVRPNVRSASGAALGDLTLHAKARLAQVGALTAGAGVHVSLPTSTQDQFTGSDLPTLRVVGLATFAPSQRLTLTANGGALLRASAAYRDTVLIEQGSGLVFGAGASVRLMNQLDGTAEIFGEWTPSDAAMLGSLSPVEGLVGLSYRIERRFTIGAAVGRGVTTGLGAPDFRGTLTLAFTSGSAPRAPLTRRSDDVRAADRVSASSDADHDGIPDAGDRCPQDAEDPDGHEDHDGCAELDNDGDGVPDAQDKCALQPEMINGVDDDDGCPDEGGDTSTGVTPGQSPAKAAEQTFLRGRDLMKEKKYVAACAAFEQSQRLDPAAGTQYNLAGCYVQIGKLATAWTIYRELARSDKNAERRAKSSELASSLTTRVPKLKLVLRGAPPGANVFMNGNNVNALIGVETPVDFGTYTLVAGAPKYPSWRRTVEVKREGDVITIEIALGAAR